VACVVKINLGRLYSGVRKRVSNSSLSIIANVSLGLDWRVYVPSRVIECVSNDQDGINLMYE
jgi:hypothetical protein